MQANAHVVRAEDYTSAQSELAALRDELGAAKGEYDRSANKVAALREELAVANHEVEYRISGEVSAIEALQAAEQRNAALTKAMERIHFRCESFSNDDRGMKIHSVRAMLDIAAKALNLTESGASE